MLLIVSGMWCSLVGLGGLSKCRKANFKRIRESKLAGERISRVEAQKELMDRIERHLEGE